MPFDSVAVDLHEVQTIFQAIDHYLVAQKSHGLDTPELESTDLGTEFADFAAPLRNHYAQLHADQAAHVTALREACAAAHREVRRFADHDANFALGAVVAILMWRYDYRSLANMSTLLLVVFIGSQHHSIGCVLWLIVRKHPILVDFYRPHKVLAWRCARKNSPPSFVLV